MLCNFSWIFTKFATQIAEVIVKAEFICDEKQKYIVHTCVSVSYKVQR